MIQLIIQTAMFGAAACYIVAVGAYLYDGQPWMAATLMCYVGAIFTLWMSGGH